MWRFASRGDRLGRGKKNERRRAGIDIAPQAVLLMRRVRRPATASSRRPDPRRVDPSTDCLRPIRGACHRPCETIRPVTAPEQREMSSLAARARRSRESSGAASHGRRPAWHRALRRLVVSGCMRHPPRSLTMPAEPHGTRRPGRGLSAQPSPCPTFRPDASCLDLHDRPPCLARVAASLPYI